jgi:Ca-activated chloride channel homolog
MRSRVIRATITMSIAALLPIFGAIAGQNEKQSADRHKPKNSSAITIGSENPASKQDPQKPQDRIVIKTNLVNLTVTVSDRLGRFVTGLSKEDFEVYDDNVKQQIAFFANEDSPVSMGIVYDVSGSMNNFSAHSVRMLRQFFENSHKEDEFFVIAFNNRTQLVHDFSSLPEEIINRVGFIRSEGSTALFDATYLATEKVRHGRHHKKVLLIFSDGEENSSRYSGRELKNLLKETDVQIYAIGMSEWGSGAPTLKFIAQPTGGQAFFPVDYGSAEFVYTRLALMLRNQYVIGFYPNNTGYDAKWHKVRLLLNAPKQLGKLNIFYKNGYWSSK